jgi:hypothetical protein
VVRLLKLTTAFQRIRTKSTHMEFVGLQQWKPTSSAPTAASRFKIWVTTDKFRVVRDMTPCWLTVCYLSSGGCYKHCPKVEGSCLFQNVSNKLPVKKM